MKNPGNLNHWPLLAFLLFLLVGINATGCAGGGGGSTGGGTGGGSGTRITGFVRDYGTNLAILAIVVDFYDVSGNLVGSGTTAADGSYTAQITGTATKFHVRSNSISASYYQEYFFGTKWYAPTVSSCKAPLPAITPNVINTIGVIRIPNAAGPPPPPPTGC